MRKIRLVVFMTVFAAMSQAALITAGTAVARPENPIPAGTTYTPGPAGGGGIDGGAISFVLPSSGTLTITIEDCCIVGDVYEAVLDGTSLGTTTPVPIDGPTPSTGVFVISGVGAGSHSLDIWDITLSYVGFMSPFGGGVVGPNFPSSPFEELSYSIEFEADVLIPEPSTLALTLTGLAIAAGIAARRRRSA